VGKTLDKMLLVIVNRERNKRFPKFFSSHRIMSFSQLVQNSTQAWTSL